MVGSFEHDMNHLAIWHTGNLLTNWETLVKLRRIYCMEFIHFGDTELASCSRMSIDPEVIDFLSPCKCIWGSGDIVTFVIYHTYIQGEFNQNTNYSDWMWSSLLGWSGTSLNWHICSPQKTLLVSFICCPRPLIHVCARARACAHTHTRTHTHTHTHTHTCTLTQDAHACAE